MKQSTEAFKFLLVQFCALDKTQRRKDCPSAHCKYGSITFGEVIFRIYPFITASVTAESSEFEMP